MINPNGEIVHASFEIRKAPAVSKCNSNFIQNKDARAEFYLDMIIHVYMFFRKGKLSTGNKGMLYKKEKLIHTYKLLNVDYNICNITLKYMYCLFLIDIPEINICSNYRLRLFKYELCKIP